MVEFPENFKIETAFNSIHLVRCGSRLELRSHDKALQSVVNLETPQRLQMANLEYLMSVLLFTAAPQRILMLGTAAGSLLHFLRHHYPQANITALDIDAELVEQLRQLQILPAGTPELTYLYDDAARYIATCKEDYDLVIVDIFNGAQTPPWLLEKTVIQQLFEMTSSGGALAFNLLIESEHDFGLFYRDLRQRFDDNTINLPVAGLENRVVYAIRDSAPANDMPSNMQAALTLSAQLEIDLMPILAVIYNTNPSGRGLI
jgi:spermidine synthase